MDYTQYIKNLLINRKQDLKKTNKNKTIHAMIAILENEVSVFDYKETTDITYIFDLFDILVVFLKDNETMLDLLYNKFTYIHNIIKTVLHSKPEEMSKSEQSRYKILQNIMNKMENTMLLIYYDNPAEYDPNKEEFIYYVVFKLKYINIFTNACEKFPHIVNSVDKEGIPLAEKVLNSYIESLDIYLSKENLGPIDDLIYYDKVLKVLFSSEKINIDDNTKKMMLEKIKEYYSSKNFTSKRHKEKLSFFINNLINIITNKEYTETIDFLNYKYEIHDKFKEAHNLEAKTIYFNHREINEEPTPRKIYTFDGLGAKEIDDGLSITHDDGIYHLGVHIADPTAYINENSILMDEAIRRTTSLYMGDYCIPLYPLILSGDLMSLNEGKLRHCMSYYFDIDDTSGELINFEIKSEVCNIEANLTYDYFDECLDSGTDNKDFFNTLMDLTNISEILKQVYNEDTIYQEFHSTKDSSLSRSVVESAMIYTNYHIAKLFSEMDLPFMYRCHNINNTDMIKLTKLQERLTQKEKTDKIIKDIEMIKNLWPRAYYTSKNCGHYGLGIDYYSHATSPLRRLADNVVNMCIKQFILSEYNIDDKNRMLEKIDELADAINKRRASAEDYEMQYMKIKSQTT